MASHPHNSEACDNSYTTIHKHKAIYWQQWQLYQMLADLSKLFSDLKQQMNPTKCGHCTSLVLLRAFIGICSKIEIASTAAIE